MNADKIKKIDRIKDALHKRLQGRVLVLFDE